MSKSRADLEVGDRRGVGAWLSWLVPVFVAGVLLLWLVSAAARAGGGGTGFQTYDYAAFGALPVSEGGRVKPLDTVARNTLLQLSGKQSLIEEMLLDGEPGDGRPAVVWLAEALSQRPEARQRAVFRIDDPDVLGLMGKTIDDGKYFSFNDIAPHLGEIEAQAGRAQDVPDDERTRFQEHVLGLRQNIGLFYELQAGLRPFVMPPTSGGEDWAPLTEPGVAGPMPSPSRASQTRGSAASWLAVIDAYFNADVARFNQAVSAHLEGVRRDDHAAAGGAADGPGLWYGVALAIGGVLFLLLVSLAWTTGRSYGTAANPAFRFLAVAGACVLLLDLGLLAYDLSGLSSARAIDKAAFEQGFNIYRPFAKGIVLYTLAGLVGLLGLLLRPLLPEVAFRAVWRSGVGILIVVFLLHTAGLLIRMWLQGRPPVTNLYSSAVFIGWAVVGFALLMEVISRLGIASLASSIVGVGTLFIAHNLAKDGDTMGVMQAVLDSNFWLGTHVITVTLGYAATFLAGFLALLYILLGMCTPLLDKKSARLLSGMVYGTICFALLFSFVGTVLGGIWADQSWGRFWGWDPKENGAVMIVLMNAVILHARWGHLVRDRGIMAMAIFGNIITAWSWFGTNLLGVGLHTYGFMEGAMQRLMLFAIANLIVIAVALAVPTRYWWSFMPKRPTPEQGSGKARPAG